MWKHLLRSGKRLKQRLKQKRYTVYWQNIEYYGNQKANGK